jgi:hypothetical protein
MLVGQKWGILQMAMLQNLSIGKIIVMVIALTKFGIDESNFTAEALARDINKIVPSRHRFVEMMTHIEHNNVLHKI